MTKIVLYFCDGKPIGFSARQHAGDGDEIGEIVCNGISALTLTCILSIGEIAKISEDDMHIEQSEAYLFFRLKDGVESETAVTLLRSMIVGLNAIAEKYENYMKIETQEV